MPGRRRELLREGTILDGRYVIGDVLGVGGFGITYSARNRHNNTCVAVKEYFSREYMTRDAEESPCIHLIGETETAPETPSGPSSGKDETEAAAETSAGTSSGSGGTETAAEPPTERNGESGTASLQELTSEEFTATGPSAQTADTAARRAQAAAEYEKNRALFEEDKARFLKEARTLRDFSDHEGIVRVLDYFEENNTAYIVMELLEGETLKRRVEAGGRMPAGEILRKLPRLLRALSAVHSAGIVHRDISPDNIMLGMDGQLTLMDFGAARTWSLSPVTHSLIYKDGFAAKEQLDKKGRLGPWTDLYALCATLYFAVTGRVPEDAFQRVLHDELKRPSALGISIEPEAEDLIMRGLRLRPEMRWQSAGAMLEEICRLYPEKNPEEEKAGKKKRRRIAAAALIAAAGIAAAVFGYYRTHEAEIRLRNVETETVYLYRNDDMTDAEYEHSAAIVEKRVENFAGRNNYLWKSDGEKLTFTVPADLFEGFEPADMTKCYISRTLKAGIIREDQEEYEELRPEEIESAEPVFAENALIPQEYYGLAAGEPFWYVTLRLTEERAGRLGAVMRETGQRMNILLDYDNQNLAAHYGFHAFTAGDGRTLCLCADGFNEVCARMAAYDLTHEKSDENFSVWEDWIVRWENPAETLFPGERQKREREITGETVLLRYSFSNASASGLYSTMYVMKKRLDAIGGPYAFGIVRDAEQSLVVKMPRANAWRVYAVTLAYFNAAYIKSETGTQVGFLNGNDTVRYLDASAQGDGGASSAMRRNELEIVDRPDGSWALRWNIEPSSAEETKTTLSELLEKGERSLYYMIAAGNYPVLSASLENALETVEENYISFDTLIVGKDMRPDAGNRSLADYLIASVGEEPQEVSGGEPDFRAYSADGVLDIELTSAKQLPVSREEYLEEEVEAITAGIEKIHAETLGIGDAAGEAGKAEDAGEDGEAEKAEDSGTAASAEVELKDNGERLSITLRGFPRDSFPINAFEETKRIVQENGLADGHFKMNFYFYPVDFGRDEYSRSIGFYIEADRGLCYNISSVLYTEEEWEPVASYLASDPWYSARKASYSD